jgi:hypothetical protein
METNYSDDLNTMRADDLSDVERTEYEQWLDEVQSWKPHNEPEGPDESMDGDHASALASAGMGTDEDYGYFGGEDDFLDGSYEE